MFTSFPICRCGRHRVCSPLWVVVRQDGTYEVMALFVVLFAAPPETRQPNENGCRNCQGSNVFGATGAK